MSAKSYDRIANACILAAIASALLFERSGSLRWLVGLFAILSGVVAAGTYLYNLRCKSSDGRPSSAADSDSDSDTAGLASLRTIGPSEIFLIGGGDLDVTRPVGGTGLLFSGLETVHASNDISGFWEGPLDEPLGFPFANYRIPERHLSTFSEQVIEIVTELARRQDSLEFVITRDGDFVIRPSATAKGTSGRDDRTWESDALDADAPREPQLVN